MMMIIQGDTMLLDLHTMEKTIMIFGLLPTFVCWWAQSLEYYGQVSGLHYSFDPALMIVSMEILFSVVYLVAYR